MTILRIDLIKGAIIDWIKANSTIMAELDDSDEVREIHWKGTDFSYPNIRVQIDNAIPFEDCYQELTATIHTFSEEVSSQECDRISGIIAQQMHDKDFTQNGIKFTHIVANPIQAIIQSENVWRSEVVIQTIIN